MDSSVPWVALLAAGVGLASTAISAVASFKSRADEYSYKGLFASFKESLDVLTKRSEESSGVFDVKGEVRSGAFGTTFGVPPTPSLVARER